MAFVQRIDDVRARNRARPHRFNRLAPGAEEAICAARGAYYGLAFGICIWAAVLFLGWLLLRPD